MLCAVTLLDRKLALGLLAAGPVACAGVVGLLRPRLVLYALAFSVAVVPKDQILLDLGLAVTLDRALVGLLGLSLAWRFWPSRRPIPKWIAETPLATPALILLGLAGIGLLHSLRPVEALLQPFYNLTVGVLVLLAGRAFLREARHRRTTGTILCWAAASIAGLGLWETWNGRYLFPFEAMHYRGGWLRAASTFGNPVPFGAFLACIAPLAWTGLQRGASRLQRMASVLCLGLILMGLVVSFSRQAYLALACGGLTLLALRRGTRLMAGGFALAVVLGSVTQNLWVQPVAAVFFDADAVSNIDHRMAMNQAALQLLIENPLEGAGLGSFRALAFTVHPVGGWKTPHHGQFPSVHNSFLTMAAELGLPGLAAFLLLIAGGLLVVLRAALRSDPEQSWRQACLSSLVAYATGALFLDSHEYLGLSTVFYVLVALGSAEDAPKTRTIDSC